MKILFLTSRAPYPPLGGDRLRALHVIKALSQQHRVTLLTFASSRAEAEALRPIAKYVERFETVRLQTRRSYLNCLIGLFSRTPLQVHYYRSAAMRRLIRACLQRERFDLIFVHLVRMADYIHDLDGLPKIMDLTDALSLNYERSAAFQNNQPLTAYALAQRVEKRRIRAYEARVVDWFDCNLLISPVDRDYLSRFAAADKVRVLGPVVDLGYFHFYDGPHDPDTIVFMGKMSTFPNQDAVRYFYREIFPLVRQRLPRLRLNIVGVEPSAEILALRRHPGVTVTGYVPDVRPHLQQAVLSICPMRTGAGAKNKVLESMAVGTPVVATALGVEGLAVRPGEHALLADSPQAFAAAIVRLAGNPALRRQLAHNGRALIAEKYSWELVLTQLNELVESLAARAPEQRIIPA
ncbi:MAG: glycosyltransferase family 4 protein [candidate division KSB1 bacterium]|nr:glycosyltransferase family 4 protein [candidate division KSB1 bacterium]MDZ7275506.1 glycosyltransferase family 4 protein [candidate division KSB1 bacterium]MDZ7286182.1 glycosyltransferase family 4 protein [candidate division KSB1 bacterium]MDZ7296408.1 glycosyltransferase family 4 protein [candidate division KSB1 bacterium]MDZ7306243.1 glycosyltransferase family 4 protein [candidate division KSB1 bacterium]